MKTLLHSLFCFLFCVLVLLACQSGTTTKDSAATKMVSTPSKIDSSVLQNVANVLSKCQKVEYVLYDYGVTFETQSTNEMQRFFSFIQLDIADTQKCPSKYDGGVVFKDIEGDIKMAMELNISEDCKRVVFEIGGKTYHQVFSDKGIELFEEIIRMRQQGG